MVPVLDISMDHRTRTGVEFTTESGGIGDVKMSALVGVAARARQRAHLHLGVSAPTGSIDERGEIPAATNVRLPYPMQVGSGTWNVLPGLTYLGQTDAWSWGAQAIGTVRLGENEYDYALGHRVSTTTWFSRRLSESASASLRLGVDRWGNISGTDPELHPRMLPTADPARRAGSRANLGVGINLYGAGDTLSGHRLALEILVPVYQTRSWFKPAPTGRRASCSPGRRPRPRVANDRLRHMLIGYARVSKADGSQSLDLQRDALQAAGVDAGHVYHDFASGVRDDRPIPSYTSESRHAAAAVA